MCFWCGFQVLHPLKVPKALGEFKLPVYKPKQQVEPPKEDSDDR
jgi:hypothetical protein